MIDLLPAAFAERIVFETKCGLVHGKCWTWTGSATKGYGRATVDGRRVSTHRYVYELLVGTIPEGLEADHLCRNTLCCNPEHLDLVTGKVNISRQARVLRTKCLAGHRMTKANTIRLYGGKHCRACIHERQESA